MNIKMILKLLRHLDALVRAAAWVSVALILVMIGSVIWEVVARKVFGAPTTWSNTVTYMLSGTMFLLGAGYTLRANRHVRIDFLAALFPDRIQHGLNFLFYLLIFLPVLFLTVDVASGKTMKAYDRHTLDAMSVWRPVIWPFLAGITLGLTTFALQVFSEMVRHLIGVICPDKLPDEDNMLKQSVL